MSTFYQKGSPQSAYCAGQMTITTETLTELEKAENIGTGGETLHRKLESCRYDLEKLEVNHEMELDDSAKTERKKLTHHCHFKEGQTSTGNSSDEEVTSLEEEIARVQSETPEKEPRIAAKEMEVLKKYYSNLFSIQEENVKLIKSNQELQLKCKESEEKLQIPNCDVDYSTLKKLKEELLTLKQTAADRNGLQTQLPRLERKLNDHHDLPEGTVDFQFKSVLIDDVLEDLHAGRVAQCPALNEQLLQFKQKANKLERQLRLATENVQSAEDDLDSMRTKCAMAEIEAWNQRTETETLKSKIVCMEQEMESLKTMCKDQEALQMEKDRLQVSLDELMRMHDDYEHMRMQVIAVDVIKAERDRYKRKCEEFTGLENECNLLRSQLEHAKLIEKEKESLQKQAEDLEKCVCEQETEIKGLVCHVSCLAQDRQQQQAKMKDEVSSLKLELEEKKNLLAISEEEIATLNIKIETTLCNLTNEAVRLRQDKEDLRKCLQRIKQEKLEIKRQCQELEEINCDLKWELQSKLKQIQDQEIQLEDRNRTIEIMQEVLSDREEVDKNLITEYSEWELARPQAELEKANVRNQQLSLKARASSESNYEFKDMLEQAKCAVKCIPQGLEQQHAKWGSNKERFRCCSGCNVKKPTVQKGLIIGDSDHCTCKPKKPESKSKEVQYNSPPTCNGKRTTQSKLQELTSSSTPTKQSSEDPQGLSLTLPNDLKQDVEEDAMFTARSVGDNLARSAELKAELLKANETIACLRQQLARAERTAAESLSLRKNLNKTLDAMRKIGTAGSAAFCDTENSKLQKDLENALEDVRTSGNETSCLRTENCKLKQQLTQLEMESTEVRSHMDHAWNSLRKTSDELRQLQDNNKRYKQRNGELEYEIAELQRRLDLAGRPIEAIDTNVKLLQEELNKLKRDLDATQNEARTSGQGNSQLCSSNIEVEAALKAKAEAENQINDLKSAVNALKIQHAQIHEAKEKLQLEKSALCQDMKRATTNLDAEKNKGKQRKSNKETKKKHSHLKSLVLVLAQEIMKERKKFMKLQKERNEIGEQLRASFAKLEAMERRPKNLIKEKEETFKGKLKTIKEGDKLTKERLDLEQHTEEAKGKSENLQSHVRVIDEELMDKKKSSFEDPKLKNEKLTLVTFETASSPLVQFTLSNLFSDDEMAFHSENLSANNVDALLKKGPTKGFRALTVEELQFIHKQLKEGVIKALERLEQKAGLLRPRKGRDNLSLLHRIIELEGDLLRGQRQASHKVTQGQTGTKLKDCRSWDLKRDLKREKRGTLVAPMKALRRRISGNINALEKHLNKELLNKMKLNEKVERPRKKMPAVGNTNALKRYE
ncbi:golgin subfamily A member 4-like isoform X3 [Euwallacea fornicatus]|uniref:golgin subfamily A member 4-like isoform X3 n=1 Tax=Euwallacea fornicatus TaxID=995702 RepID=UPI00338EAA9F